MNTNADPTKSPSLLSKDSLQISNRAFFLLLVLVFVVKALIYHKNFYILDIVPWHTQELTMDYSYGFVRRGLLGSFVTLIKNLFNLQYPDAIKIVQCIGVLLFITAIILFFRKLLSDSYGKTFFFVILLYIALDNIGFELCLFGLLDTYTIAITLLIVFLIIKDKALFLIPILAGTCVLIHEAYPMLFFSITVALLIYRFCYADNKKAKFKYAIVFVLTGLTVSILFFLSYFTFARIANPDPEAIIASCWEKAGGRFESSNLRMLWIDTLFIPGSLQAEGQMWIDGKPTEQFFILMRLVIMNIIICSPLIVMTFLYWKKIIKNESKVFRKLLLTLCSLSVFLILPLIIIHCDQGRWFYAIVLFETVTIASISLMNFNQERKVLAEMSKFSIPKVLIIVFYSVFFYVRNGYELNYISVSLVRIYALLFMR